jgi:hypothetical protein
MKVPEHKIRTAIKAYLDAGGDLDFYIVSKKYFEDFLPKTDVLKAIGGQQNTHWGACNNHGNPSKLKCVCPVEDRNTLRLEILEALGMNR